MEQFLVTIDRECRQLFLVERSGPSCRPILELRQHLDDYLEDSLTPDARAWTRGLKTICRIPDGYVVCDIFGIYRLSEDFSVRHYVSLPGFTDLHSAIPYGETLLVTNTGADEVLWIDWSGKILDCLRMHAWFPATPWMENDLGRVNAELKGDRRLMPLDWARESCHLNWAEQTPLGVLLSCFIQGEILFFRDGAPVQRIAAGAKLHTPRFLPETRTIVYAASEDNRIVEIDLNGNEVWSMEGFQFAKYVDRLTNGNLIVADTGNRRIAEIDRGASRVVWECELPGTPYCVLPIGGKQTAGARAGSLS